MSSVVENQALLSGRVLSRAPHPSVARWEELVVRITSVEPVPDMPNLLVGTVGQQVVLVANRDELPEGDLDGWLFTGLARLAGPGVVEVLPAGTGVGSPSLVPPG